MHKARQKQTNHPLPAPSAGKCKTGAKRGKSRVSHTGYTCLADHLTPSRAHWLDNLHELHEFLNQSGYSANAAQSKHKQQSVEKRSNV